MTMGLDMEAVLLFFLLLRLMRTIKTFSPDPLWEKRLRYGMIATGVFLLLDPLLPFDKVSDLLWYPLLFGTISLAFREPRFFATRMTMYAVLPLVLFSFMQSLTRAFGPAWQMAFEQYDGYAEPAVYTWMVALLILSHRQLKALKTEHRMRLQEEEENRAMALRKRELEALVAERTAELVQQKDELHHALEELRSTQAQLIQREKMASLGELTAGIAHEIKNPLNFVNNFSELSVELVHEIQDHVKELPMAESEREFFLQLLQDLVENQKKIHYHGQRADAIVRSMLLHSQNGAGRRELTNINALVEEYLRLAYHGLRAKDKSFSSILETHFDERCSDIAVVPQDMGRVLLNLFNNAFYSVAEKRKQLSGAFEPTVSVSTRQTGNRVEITVKDNGNGIAPGVREKIFQPFFTTKPTGEGAGLGLSLSYDIVTKVHGGEISIDSKEGAYAAFKIILPATANRVNSQTKNA